MSASNIIPIPAEQRRVENLGAGVYLRGGAYYHRPRVNGRETWRRLRATTLRKAQLEAAKKKTDQQLSKLGLAQDPYLAPAKTIAALARPYLEAGCPKANKNTRAGKQLTEEQRRVKNLLAVLGKTPWPQINIDKLNQYHAARIRQIAVAKKSPGHRAVDLELVTLSAIIRHAMRSPGTTGVTRNPLDQARVHFAQTDTIRHCRSCQPADAEELHALARYLFTAPNSEPLAWLVLFQAMTGQRVSELLHLRIDAADNTHPGFTDSKFLYLYRSTTHKGTYHKASLHTALAHTISAHRQWLVERFPASPWYFPSPVDAGVKHIDSSALTKALGRICPAMGLPHRTSHGLRSYFVNVLRAQGKTDSEIALRIGHKTGGKLIIEVYGESDGENRTWTPAKTEPAWNAWRQAPQPVQLELGL